MIVYFNDNFCVKGVLEGLVFCVNMWWVFGWFFLISKRIFVFLFNFGKLVVKFVRWEWVCVMFGVGIFFL